MSDTVSPTQDSWRELLRGVATQLNQPAEATRQLLAELVARAVAAVGAAEGSVLIADADGHCLKFLVSHSPVADKLANMRVPIEGSIAGYVYSTNEMMAVGDLAEEKPAAFYAEVDRQSGIATRTYLAVPILLHGQAYGVATYVNRPGPPPFRPFQQDEMEHARAFAAVQAVLLRHLRRTQHLNQLAACELAAALTTLDPMATQEPSNLPSLDKTADPWVLLLELIEQIPLEDQPFCAELIALVLRRRTM